MSSPTWRKSRYSQNDANCVEVSGTLDVLRDSKCPNSVLKGDVAALVRAIRNGHLAG